jgi:hypothetical protein
MYRFCQIYVIEFVSQFPNRRIEMFGLASGVVRSERIAEQNALIKARTDSAKASSPGTIDLKSTSSNKNQLKAPVVPAIPAQPFPPSDYVDIGGECFNITGTTDAPPETQINTTKTYDFVCKSKTQFYKTFKEIISKFPNTIRLFSIYLPYQKEQLRGITDKDKVELKAIIEARITSLQDSVNHNNQPIKNMQFVRYHDNLKSLIKEIDATTATTSTTSLSDLEKRIVYKFPKKRVYYVLMELAWYLLHPKEIKTNSDSWMKLLDAVDTINLGKFVESIHKSNDMFIDVDRVEKADKLASAISPPDASAELKKRLESILQLFVAQKYLKAPLQANDKGPIVNEKTIKELESTLPRSHKTAVLGGGNNTNSMNVTSINTTSSTNNKNVNSFKINSESVAKMMKPFYDFFKEKYGPITSKLSKDLPDGLSLVSLSKLLFVCQKITSQSPIQHGIYRIINIDPAMFEFLRNQLGSVQAYVNDETRPDEERKSFTDMAGFVPIVSIKSLLNKFGKSGHYTDPETIPTVRIMMMGMNIDPYKNKDAMKIDINDDFQKEQIYQAATTFFTDQSIYLVCNEAKATHTSMNVFEVNYLDVNVSKNEWSVSNMDENYFNKFKEPPLFLEDVMDVKSHIVYNHGMLALSMFIASEELLPK